ncbi:hypothetical protein D3C80_1997890 [compost metagenome]
MDQGGRVAHRHQTPQPPQRHQGEAEVGQHVGEMCNAEHLGLIGEGVVVGQLGDGAVEQGGAGQQRGEHEGQVMAQAVHGISP